MTWIVTAAFVVELLIMAILGVVCGTFLAFVRNEYGKGWAVVAAFCVAILIGFTAFGTSRLVTFILTGGL